MGSRSVRLWYLLASWLLFSVLLLAIGFQVLAAPLEESQEEQETETEMPTVAQDLEQIEAEPGVNALGETVPESVDYYALASQAIEQAYYEELQARYETTEETTLSPQEDFLLDASLNQVQQAPILAAPRVDPELPEAKAYLLDLDGTQYYAWFPAGARVVVTDEGYIYNEGSTNISALISTSLNGASLDSYNDFVTIAPLLATSSNNNAYRYHSRVYITHYYEQSGYLYNDVTYISTAKALKEPGAGYGFSNYQYVVFGALFLIVILLFVKRGSRS